MRIHTKSKRVVYFIQLPPPVHGVSKVNQIIFNSELINKNIKKYLIRVNYSASINDINKFGLSKLYKYFVNVFIVFKVLLIKKPAFLYYTIPPTGITFYKEIPFVLITKFLGILPVYHLHGKGIAENIVRRPFLQSLYRFVFNNSVVIHLSNGLMNMEIAPLKLKNARMFVVGNGIEKFEPPLRKTDENINVLFFSNIQKPKGFYVLLESFSTLSLKYPQLLLNVMGNFINELEKQNADIFIYKHKLETKIHFWGQVSSVDKYQLMAQNDIFVHPTLNDAFPLVILEAMQCGLPVISTFEGAIPEIIDDGINGFLVPKSNVVILSKKLETLINDQNLRRQMGLAGRNKFLSKYTVDIFEQNIKNVFDQILNHEQ